MGKKPHLISIAIPARNEEGNLAELYRRVTKVVDSILDYDFEVLLIDNCSEDKTEQISLELAEKDKRWKYIRFSRNFGLEVSLAAGLHYAKGDAIIYLSSDLQEPPEVIPTMIEKWKEGYDVVYGVVETRNDFNKIKTLGARTAYKLIHVLSDVNIPPNATDFRLISRPVIEALRRCGEKSRYMRGLVHWVGFRQTGFTYKRSVRTSGESDFGLVACFNFATTALVAFSTKPLRWASFLGIITTAGSILGASVYTIQSILSWYGIGTVPPPRGWTTLMLLIFFFGGVQCLFIGIIGEYLSRVYDEAKQRPLWVLRSTAGFSDNENPLTPN